MSNTESSTQSFQNFQAGRYRRDARGFLQICIIIIVTSLVVGMGVWYYQHTQPITELQRTALTALAESKAARTGKTRLKVWAELKMHLKVRRIQDITQKDFGTAKSFLLESSM
ncbi:MAG: hypothetical protein HQL90_15095 [Magnetococcales bacterium]|nr:hypothetical protein [Magnetococcales bacterium]